MIKFEVEEGLFCHPNLYFIRIMIILNFFADLIFMDNKLSTKTAKIITLKILYLYGHYNYYFDSIFLKIDYRYVYLFSNVCKMEKLKTIITIFSDVEAVVVKSKRSISIL